MLIIFSNLVSITLISAVVTSGVMDFTANEDWQTEQAIAADVTAVNELNSQIQSAKNQPSSWQTIRKRGKLIIGVKDNLPPLGFRDRQQNLAGLEVDIARQLAQELNLVLELVPISNRDRLAAIQSQRIDLAIAQITVTNNRARLVDFSLPYYSDSTIVIAPRSTSISQLQQANIAVLKNSTAIAAIQWQIPQATIIGTESYQAGLMALQSGRVQAFVGDRSSLTQWLRENPDYGIIGQPLAVHSLAIAMPRGLAHLELREAVLPIVTKWRKNGWLQDRIQYWGL